MGKYLSPATAWAHSSDATFRAWVIEFQAAMAGAGLVLAADTGQIDTATVLRPAINTLAGFNIYRFDDSLQATAPIYIRVDYGTGASASTPRVDVRIATGTDGAGGMAGVAIKTAAKTMRSTTNAVGTGNYVTYAYHRDGVFWIAFKFLSLGSGSAAAFGFMVCRTCDNDRTPNEEGVALIASPSSATAASENSVAQLRFADAPGVMSDESSRYHTMVVGNVSTSADGLTLQPYLWFLNVPRVQPCFGLLTYLSADIPDLTVFPAAPVGVDDGSYIALRHSFGGAGIGGAHVAAIWED